MTPSQLSLLDQPTGPMVRATDPPTSRVAAKRTCSGDGHRRVLLALSELAEATDEQIRQHAACRRMSHGSVSKRRRDLERLDQELNPLPGGPGLVVRCGVDDSDGTPRLKFRITDAGRRALAKLVVS